MMLTLIFRYSTRLRFPFPRKKERNNQEPRDPEDEMISNRKRYLSRSHNPPPVIGTHKRSCKQAKKAASCQIQKPRIDEPSKRKLIMKRNWEPSFTQLNCNNETKDQLGRRRMGSTTRLCYYMAAKKLTSQGHFLGGRYV